MRFVEYLRKGWLLNILTEKIFNRKILIAPLLSVSYLPTYIIAANINVCPRTIHVVESVLMPLIDVIEPFGTSVFNIAFVFLMTEKHNRKFTLSESIRD